MDKKDIQTKGVIEDIHREHPWYGHRCIGWTTKWSFGKVRRIMKKFNLKALVKKAR